jgi:phage repressor protein C with HTH and peptisase S24 domain
MEAGWMVLRSANLRWDDIEVDMRGDQAELIRIIGRVIWWCREAR